MEVNSSALEPDTAPNIRSIWKGVDRKAFEQRTQSLFKRQHVAGRCSYQACPSPIRDREYAFPFEVEKSLADDFAFIAASQPQVGYVSAAAIEQQQTNDSFVLKLTANEGVPQEVAIAFNQLFQIMSKHASKGKLYLAEQIFRLIVQLNCNKILGRLGSSRFRPPVHLLKTREPLPSRLRSLVRNNLPSRLQVRVREDLNKLYHQIDELEVAMRKVDAETSKDLVPHIELAVKQAYHLTENGVRFPDRLSALGCKASCLDARDVREVGKVSNYWRISRHLALCSRRFRSCFSHAAWTPLPNYKPSKTSKLLSRQYVHAEIQLLVHFELNNPKLMPRTIGVSKEACFLCDSFIRAHGQFFIAGAHRQIFPQWTIPDLEEYSSQTTENFRRALAQVFLELQEEHRKAQKKLPWRPYPLQSAIDLNVIRFTTPSASTLPGNQLDEAPQPAGSDSSSMLSKMHRKASNTDLLDTSKSEGLPKAQYGEEQGIENECRNSNLIGSVIEITADRAIERYTSWLEIFAALSASPDNMAKTMQQQSFERASVALEPVPCGACQRRVYLAELPLKGEVVLDRDLSDALHEISFILIGSRGEEVLVRCKWHVSSDPSAN